MGRASVRRSFGVWLRAITPLPPITTLASVRIDPAPPHISTHTLSQSVSVCVDPDPAAVSVAHTPQAAPVPVRVCASVWEGTTLHRVLRRRVLKFAFLNLKFAARQAPKRVPLPLPPCAACAARAPVPVTHTVAQAARPRKQRPQPPHALSVARVVRERVAAAVPVTPRPTVTLTTHSARGHLYTDTHIHAAV